MLLYKHTLGKDSGDLLCLFRRRAKNEGETGERGEIVKQAEKRRAYCSVYTLSPALLPFSLFDIFMQIWAGWFGSMERINSSLCGLGVAQ